MRQTEDNVEPTPVRHNKRTDKLKKRRRRMKTYWERGTRTPCSATELVLPPPGMRFLFSTPDEHAVRCKKPVNVRQLLRTSATC